MSSITKVERFGSGDGERIRVVIDGTDKVVVRARTWSAMGLDVGSEITAAELREREKFFWKQAYGEASWEAEKGRIAAVKKHIEALDPDLEVRIVGFGADTCEMISEHPDEPGAPDLDVVLRGWETVAMMSVEVSGTESMRPDTSGETYWVRLDKLEFACRHPEIEYWIALHYAKPNPRLVFILPDTGKAYQSAKVEIRGAGERMVVFTANDPEVRKESDFHRYLNMLKGHREARAMLRDPSRRMPAEVRAAFISARMEMELFVARLLSRAYVLGKSHAAGGDGEPPAVTLPVGGKIEGGEAP